MYSRALDVDGVLGGADVGRIGARGRMMGGCERDRAVEIELVVGAGSAWTVAATTAT